MYTYTTTLDVGRPVSCGTFPSINSCTYTITGIPNGLTYFVATAYNTSGNESEYSNIVSKDILALTQYALMVSKSGTGAGTVNSTGISGISCGSDCTELYDQNTAVTLTATATAGSDFTGWAGAGCSGTGTCVATMDTAKAVTATFKYKRTITATAGAGGTITPSSYVTVYDGENQTFTIAASEGYVTDHLLIDGLPVTVVPSYTFTNVTANHTIETSFIAILPDTYALTIAKSGTGTGTITSLPAGINCGSDCSEVYSKDTVITLSAAPDISSTFTSWSGSGCSGTGACIVTMTSTKAVTAAYTIKTNTVTTSAGAGGTISPSGAVFINYGASQIFTITPSSEYHISAILIDGISVSITNPYTFTNVTLADITSDHSMDVGFALDVPEEETTTIIDNGDINTSYAGTWYVSAGTNQYGTDSLWSRDGTYTWVFTPTQTGNYELYMWWSCYDSRQIKAIVFIGALSKNINQSKNCGQWNIVGTYSFISDISYNVSIMANGRLTTCADAIKFILKP
jgi:hypothetical protein